MSKRMLERIAVMLLSIAMLVSSTGIMSSLAANAGEATSASSSTATTFAASTTKVVQEGGTVASTTVAGEGGALSTPVDGSGTVTDPYKISSVEQFLGIRNKINSSANANKYFVLTSDLDFSGIKGTDFESNGGSLLCVNKALSAKSSNVFLFLNGAGHKIKGLDITVSSETVSIFGYLSKGSTIKNLTIVNPKITASANIKRAAVIAAENDGTIQNVNIEYPVMNLKNVVYAGTVAAVNNGAINSCTIKSNQTNAGAATATSFTIAGSGVIGGVAGINRGRITANTVISMGIFASGTADSSCAAVAGYNSGSITDSFVAGNIGGGKADDTAGGIVGKAVAPAGKTDPESQLINNYVLVSVAFKGSGCGVIGASGKASMINNCYWSSMISGRDTMCSGYGAGVNDIGGLTFKVMNTGESFTLSAASVTNTWGKASLKTVGEFKISGSGAAIESSVLKGVKDNTVSYVRYLSEITLPASVGASKTSIVVKQHLRFPVMVVPAGVKGEGTSASPLEIGSSAVFNLIRYTRDINAKLTKDVSFSGAAYAFKGTLDGNGHTINTAAPIFNTVYGTVSNVNILVKASISKAVFGNAVNATVSNVSVAAADKIVFEIASGNSGAFFNNVAGTSKIDNCRINVNMNITADKTYNIGAFAGRIGGRSVVTNSGANANINTNKESVKSVAVFAGALTGEAKISNCYAAGNNAVTGTLFAGDVPSEKVAVSSSYWSASTSGQKPLDFDRFGKIIDKSQFTLWSFKSGEVGFFTGNSGDFAATLPAIKALKSSSASDFKVKYDSSKLKASVKVENSSVVLHVERAKGVVTVKESAVAVTNIPTGLTAYIKVSNGLEKDANGNYIVSNGYDLAYIGENIEEMKASSFTVTSDIDMSSVSGFAPIGGTTAAFSGVFNGNGHVIKNMSVSGTAKAGLFATLDGADVRNIVFENAKVASEGSYAGILAGQAVGKTAVSGIRIVKSSVKAGGTYAGLLAGEINGAEGLTVKDIQITDSSLNTVANYAGAVSGRIGGYASVSGVKINKLTAVGGSYIAGAFGISDSASKVDISDISVNESNISGTSFVAGIIGSGSANININNATVAKNVVSTTGTEAGYVAGGIAASYGSTIENSAVTSLKINGGTVGGIVGATSDKCKLIIRNTSLDAAAVNSTGEANTFAGGILAVHHSEGSVVIEGVSLSESTSVNNGSLTAGLVADVAAESGSLSVKSTVSRAAVNGCTNANAVAASGAIGAIGAVSVNDTQIDSVKIAGTVNGSGSVAGFVGVIRRGTVFNSSVPMITASVAACAVSAADADSESTTGMIVGKVEKNQALTAANVREAIRDVIISTYFGDIKAYSEQSGLSGGYYDMDKPGGKAITPSVDTLKDSKDTVVTLSNLPKAGGFSFDKDAGWASESDERVLVVSSGYDSVTLRALHKGELSILAYYTMTSDPSFRVPVHFVITSAIRTPLNGEGTKASPYLISNAFELETISEYAADGAYFVLTNDIVFKDEDFRFGGAFYNVGNGIVTIGDAQSAFTGSFSGMYNGKINTIKGLKLSGNVFGGLFGATDSATITDLIIESPDVSGLNYAGVIVGSAKNTFIGNITVNNAKVRAEQINSLAGSVVGYGENVTINGVKVNGADVSTTLDGSSATVEAAGGAAGVFSGKITDSEFNGLKVSSGTVSGGLIGEISADSPEAQITGVSVDADVTAYIAGGVIGSMVKPGGLEANGVSVKGSVNAENTGAGLIAAILSESSADSVDKLEKPMLKDTVCAVSIAPCDFNGVVAAKVSEKVFNEKENAKISVFENVYYSSYNNDMPIFGTGAVNAYQNDEYKVRNINSVMFKSGDRLSNLIMLGDDYTALTQDNIVLQDVGGSFKMIDAGKQSFALTDVTSNVAGLVSFDAANTAVKLNFAAPEDAELIFVYDNGLKASIAIAPDSTLAGKGTEQEPYIVASADDFTAMASNGDTEGVYYELAADISLKGVGSFDTFAGILNGDGHMLFDYTGAPLFGTVTGSISNTGFVGFNVISDGAVSTGAVAGVLDGALIDNVLVIADVYAEGAQDAGIIAGRMINSAVISDSVSSGKVIGASKASGGLAGATVNSTVVNSMSTAYVSSGCDLGGLIGNASYSNVSDSIFGGMVEKTGNNAGNIFGRSENTVSSNVYFDKQTTKVDAGDASGETVAKGLATRELAEQTISGFTKTVGYPVPSELISDANSPMFTTCIAFAAAQFVYVSGLNSGSAYNYTEIKTPAAVNDNPVSTEKTASGLTVKLMPGKNSVQTGNAVARFADPAAVSAVDVSYSIADSTGTASDKLIAVLMKSTAGDSSNTFDLFTRPGAEIKEISGVSVADGGIYAQLVLPDGYSYSVSAVDEEGNPLPVDDRDNMGKFIDIGSSSSVVLSFTITADNDDMDWGARSVWGSIGK